MCAELVILLYNSFPSEMSGEQRLKKTPLFPIAQKITSFFPLSHSPASLKTLTFYLEKCCFYSPVCPLSPLLHPHSLDSSAHLHTPPTVKGKTKPNTKSNLKFTYPQNQSLLVTWISTNPCSPLVQ